MAPTTAAMCKASAALTHPYPPPAVYQLLDVVLHAVQVPRRVHLGAPEQCQPIQPLVLCRMFAKQDSTVPIRWLYRRWPCSETMARFIRSLWPASRELAGQRAAMAMSLMLCRPWLTGTSHGRTSRTCWRGCSPVSTNCCRIAGRRKVDFQRLTGPGQGPAVPVESRIVADDCGTGRRYRHVQPIPVRRLLSRALRL